MVCRITVNSGFAIDAAYVVKKVAILAESILVLVDVVANDRVQGPIASTSHDLVVTVLETKRATTESMPGDKPSVVCCCSPLGQKSGEAVVECQSEVKACCECEEQGLHRLSAKLRSPSQVRKVVGSWFSWSRTNCSAQKGGFGWWWNGGPSGRGFLYVRLELLKCLLLEVWVRHRLKNWCPANSELVESCLLVGMNNAVIINDGVENKPSHAPFPKTTSNQEIVDGSSVGAGGVNKLEILKRGPLLIERL